MKPSISWKSLSSGVKLVSRIPHARIGIDEKAFRKGHSLITLIYDLDRSTVDAISDGNDIHTGNTAFYQPTEDQLAPR
jgi:transposase